MAIKMTIDGALFKLEEVPFTVLNNKTIVDVSINARDSVVSFVTSENDVYYLCHIDECCEDVDLIDISGDLQSLIGQKILFAEEVSNDSDTPLDNLQDSYTWTYYKLASRGGYITLSWFGISNGYYTESVSLYKVVY